MIASPISRMLPGSLAEGPDAHQRPGRACTGARNTSAGDAAGELTIKARAGHTRYSIT